MKYLLNVNQGNESNAQCSKRILLQLPAKDTKSVKINPNRGSWPGLNTSNNLCATELSKSEQHLLQDDIINDDTTYMSNVSQTANDEGSGSKDCSKSFASTKSIKSSSSTYLSGTTVAMSSSKSEDILSPDRHKHNRSGLRNNFTIVKSISADINPQLGEKSTTYERTMKDISIDSAANTTTPLSVKSLNSDSIHLPYTDNFSAISHPIRSHISTVHTKSEVLKSTASVAATASISMDTRLDELKDQSTVLPVPPPGILQVKISTITLCILNHIRSST